MLFVSPKLSPMRVDSGQLSFLAMMRRQRKVIGVNQEVEMPSDRLELQALHTMLLKQRKESSTLSFMRRAKGELIRVLVMALVMKELAVEVGAGVEEAKETM